MNEDKFIAKTSHCSGIYEFPFSVDFYRDINAFYILPERSNPTYSLELKGHFDFIPSKPQRIDFNVFDVYEMGDNPIKNQYNHWHKVREDYPFLSDSDRPHNQTRKYIHNGVTYFIDHNYDEEGFKRASSYFRKFLSVLHTHFVSFLYHKTPDILKPYFDKLYGFCDFDDMSPVQKIRIFEEVCELVEDILTVEQEKQNAKV